MSTADIFKKYLEYYSSEQTKDTVGIQSNYETDDILNKHQDIIFSPSAMRESTHSSLIDTLAKIKVSDRLYDVANKIMKVFELLKKDTFYYTLDLTRMVLNRMAFEYVLEEMRILRLYYDGLSDVGYISLPAGEHIGNHVQTILTSFGIERGQY